MKTVLFLVVILCFVEDSLGYCYLHPFQDSQCTAPNGVTIPAGGELIIPEKCEKCSCSAHGVAQSTMSCCGYGSSGGLILPPMGCKLIKGEDGCSVRMVQIANETLPC